MLTFPDQKGINNYNWRGGRCKDKKGYWFIRMPEYFASYDNGYVLEHIYNFQEYHKCCMLPWGEVHHVEPVTEEYCNNMIWNLKGMTSSQHTGLHNKVESGRHCSKCNSMNTLLHSKDKHPLWYKDGLGGYFCSKCRDKNRRSKKIKSLSF